ncbi:MAG: DUF3256 family protein [Bacteroidaceae bacterium]|nr:DUF3256 family protein [Bacteroidaceae bacterium]
MRKLLSLALSCFFLVPVYTQEIKQLFKSMPDSIIPILTPVNRADCIEFMVMDMQAKVTNRFDTPSEMTRLTDDFIALKPTAYNEIQLKTLPIDSTLLICMINTVCSKACDSRIRFFNTRWEELEPSQYFTFPKQTDFLPDTISSAVADTLSPSWEELHSQADMLLIHLEANDSLPLIKASYTTLDYMNPKEASKLRPLLTRETIIYEWNNGKFTRREHE